MFYKELDSIRAVEDKADEIIQNANADAKKTVADSKAQADRIIEDGKARGDAIIAQYIKEGRIIADRNYEDRMKEANQEAVQIERSAYKNKKEAINIIAERIVKSSVNC